MNVLVINAGSSSLKYQLLNPTTGELLAKGLCERIGIDGLFTYKPQLPGKEAIKAASVSMPTHNEAIQAVLNALVDEKNGVIGSMKEIDAVGHRVVHGGEKFAKSVVITDEVMQAIEECTPLAPLHNPANIIGIKEASGNIEQIQQIIDHRPEGFLVLSGDDALTIELMRRGGDGVISVAANAFPQRFMQCVHLAEKGDFEAAGREYAALDEAVQALFEEGNPVGVKCALSVMGKIGPTMRLPLVEGTAALREKFRRLIAEYDLR